MVILLALKRFKQVNVVIFANFKQARINGYFANQWTVCNNNNSNNDDNKYNNSNNYNNNNNR